MRINNIPNTHYQDILRTSKKCAENTSLHEIPSTHDSCVVATKKAHKNTTTLSQHMAYLRQRRGV